MLLVCFGLAGFFRSGVLSPKPDGPRSRAVFAGPIDNPTMLIIRDRSGAELAFHHRSGVWQMDSPILARAKQDRLERIVRMMQSLEYTRSFQPADDTPGDVATGLARPIWTIVLAGPTGRTNRLHVGAATPKLGSSKSETFVRPAGSQKTFVVALDLPVMLIGGVEDYRENEKEKEKR
ncbi:MAG: hypothetical protein DRP83_05485 [Planctomycetota bacterium]|nr:MAG: hypothetical protein DRP83_05485 [Planctomycetota bacterium]